MSRLATERAFHDEQAARRRPDLPAEALRFTDDAYLDHETWLRPAFEKLGDVRGLDVLDLGCGHGMASVVLGRRGGHVTALELSEGYLRETLDRAAANGVALDAVQADAQQLPFADQSFDRIWGHAILHHLDIERGASELRRVLRPNGRVVLCEPWGDNPLLSWARRRLPYSGKHRTPDEEPLRSNCLPILQKSFSRVEWQGYQLMSMFGRVAGESAAARVAVRAAVALDRLCLRCVPPLERWCRYGVLTLSNL